VEPKALEAKALLCDYAQVAGKKLFISGAGINLIGVPNAEPPLVVNFALAILLTIPWNATNQAHKMTVELVSEQSNGSSQRVPLTGDDGVIIAEFNAGRSPIMKPGEDTLLPVALPMFGLSLPEPGSYFFSIELDGSPADRVSFRAEVVNPMNISTFGAA
jgi:hypothetical protein